MYIYITTRRVYHQYQYTDFWRLTLWTTDFGRSSSKAISRFMLITAYNIFAFCHNEVNLTIKWRSYGIVDCDIVVSEFELQSYYDVHFQTNALRKGMERLISSIYVTWSYAGFVDLNKCFELWSSRIQWRVSIWKFFEKIFHKFKL